MQPLLMKGEEHKVSAKRPYSIVTCRSPAAAREARKLLRAVARNQGLALTIGKKKKVSAFTEKNRSQPRSGADYSDDRQPQKKKPKVSALVSVPY